MWARASHEDARQREPRAFVVGDASVALVLLSNRWETKCHIPLSRSAPLKLPRNLRQRSMLTSLSKL